MENKRGICLLNDSFPPSIDGVANAVSNYARIIDERYGSAMVMTPDYPGADDSVWKFPVLRYPSLDLRKQIGFMAGFPFSPELSLALKENKVELLHSHCPVVSTILARELKSTVDAPLVLTYHTKFDIDIAKAVKGKALQESAIRALVANVNGCDEVWVVSRGAGENLRSLGFGKDYTVMPNGVDLPLGRVSDEKIREACAGYDLPAGVPVFLFIGRMMWYKGLRIILDALAFVKEMDIDFRMVFVGDGTDMREVQDYAKTLRLDGKCLFTGPVRNRETLRAWYARADLFLFPSTFDTNGLVVREAAASGLASVLVRGSCAAEDTKDCENAFWIDENAAALGAKLVRLTQNPDLMKRAGEAAARDLYCSWEDAVKAAWDRYGTVIENYKSGRYKPDRSFDELVFRGTGEIMEYLGELEGTRRDIERRLNAQHQATQEKLQEAYTALWNIMDRYL